MKILTLLALFVSLGAQAQEKRVGQHAVAVVLSSPQGGLSLGAGYEYLLRDSLGIEAHLRMFSKEDGPKNMANGMKILGVGAAHHFYKKSWDLAFSPSFNIINIENAARGGSDATVMGPGLSLSLLCQMTNNVAVGFDWSNYWAWFDDEFAGKRVDDLALKAQFSF